MTRDEVRLALAERLPELREPCWVNPDSHDHQYAEPEHDDDIGIHPAQGCPGWVPKDWHLEDLLWLWVERDFDPWSFISLFAPIPDTPAEILEAAERAALEALGEDVHATS